MLQLTIKDNFNLMHGNICLDSVGDADEQFIRNLPYVEGEMFENGKTKTYPPQGLYENNMLATKLLNLMREYKGEYAEEPQIIEHSADYIDVVYRWED